MKQLLPLKANYRNLFYDKVDNEHFLLKLGLKICIEKPNVQ